MNSQDWERFGDEIRRTVQNAVDTQDYAKLNQRISNTVNEALNGAAQSIKHFGESVGRPGTGNGYGTGKANWSGNAYGAGNANRTGYSYSTGNYTTGSSQGAERYEYGQNYTRGPRQAGQVYRAQTQTSVQSPALFESLKAAKAGGVILAVLGYGIGGPLLLAFLIVLLCAIAMGDFGIGFRIALITVGILTAGCSVMAWQGTLKLGRIKRFRAYIQVLKGREYCDVKELTGYVKKPLKFIVKDLERMIAKGWFRQGHLDQKKSCLMVSNQAYGQYLQLEDQMRQKEEMRKQEEKKAQEESKTKQSKQSKLSPDVQKIIDQGDEYVRKIRKCNDAIPGEEISAKISRMEMLVDRIFDRVEQNPDAVSDIRRLMEYYLPTTVKLLEAYEELDAQPVGGENIQTAKREIEATLDTLNSAFEKLLDDLFQDTAWDVSSDISVLHTMLAQEGLMENGIPR